MPTGNFESKFESHMKSICDEIPDPSHDILHVRRVVALAKKIAKAESVELKVVIPAAYLHDCVYISKADPRRPEASLISANKALELLSEWKYPEAYFSQIHHAIAAHSFSANIPAQSIEAKVVQDADRLDAMGAVGIFKCFAFSGLAARPFYSEQDIFCDHRQPNDQTNTLDHFFTKLLKLNSRLNTESAKVEGNIRMRTMQKFVEDLRIELS